MEPIDDIETAYHSFRDMINYIPVSSLTDLQSQAKYLDIIRDIVYRVIRKNVPYSRVRVVMSYRYFISDHNINLFTGDTSVSLGVDYIVTVHCDDTFCNSDFFRKDGLDFHIDGISGVLNKGITLQYEFH
jgi:hypothetical protein